VKCQVTRIVFGFLSGIVGMLAGWFGLAFLVIGLAGPDRDGGVAMGAFFNIGPLGAFGVWLFVKFGLVAQGAAFCDRAVLGAGPRVVSRCCGRPGAGSNFRSLRGRRSGDRRRPFGWAWYEFVRSPYLMHGYMDFRAAIPAFCGYGGAGRGQGRADRSRRGRATLAGVCE